MKINCLNIDEYYELKERLSEIAPDIKLKLIPQDIMLKSLWVSDTFPCVFEIIATQKQIDVLCKKSVECKGKSEESYLKYGWISDYITNHINDFSDE